MSKLDSIWLRTPLLLKCIIIVGVFMLFAYTTISLDLVPPPPEVHSSTP